MSGYSKVSKLFGLACRRLTLDGRRLALAANNSTILRLARASFPTHTLPLSTPFSWWYVPPVAVACVVCRKVCGSLSKFKRLKRQHMFASSARQSPLVGPSVLRSPLSVALGPTSIRGCAERCRHNSLLMLLSLLQIVHIFNYY